MDVVIARDFQKLELLEEGAVLRCCHRKGHCPLEALLQLPTCQWSAATPARPVIHSQHPGGVHHGDLEATQECVPPHL